MQMTDGKMVDVPARTKFASTVGNMADAAMKRFDEETKIPRGEDETPTFSWNELRMGKLLGTGGFNSVYEVFIPVKASQDEGMSSSAEEETSTCSTPGGMDGPYAIKSLKHSVMSNRHSFLAGAVDLVYEAKLLSVLNHKNIIKIHGIPKGRVSDTYLGGGYFIIIDKLVGTVEDKIAAWRQGLELYSSPRTCTKPGSTEEINCRLKNVAIPVAEAMTYLHSKKVIFRDLKPSNIGLDQRGTVKLFDFGLAREITDPNRVMTGCTGSRRYMAPEVATHQFYSLPADVYSFGIMLWEIVTLIKPFEDMSRSEHMDIVIRGRVRPWIDSTCGSVALRKLMQSAWDRTPAHRPNYCKIIKILVEETNSDSVWGCESNSENKQPPWYNRGVAGFLRGCNTKSPSKQHRGRCAA